MTAAALLGALLLIPVRAHAQDDVTLSMARERFKEGVAYFDKKDFAKARVAFLQAYALKKHPSVLLNLAQSELRSGHEADAAKHFSQYLREHKDATDNERQGAETGLTAAKALVGEIMLAVDATGAEVYVDGDLEGQTPLSGAIFLAPGSHELQARKEGKSASTSVTAAAGQSNSVSLKLSAPKPAAPVAGAASTAAGEENAPEPETHRKAFFPWLGSTPVAMIGVGVTGVGLIGGGAFALGSKSSYNSAEDAKKTIETTAVEIDGKSTPTGACNDIDNWLQEDGLPIYDDPATRQTRVAEYEQNCQQYQDNIKAGDTFKTLAIVSLSVGGAAAIGTIIYYFVDSKEEGPSPDSARRGKPQRRLAFVPVYEPGYAGGIVLGTF
ncbi:MAG TPA: PEGA domain-containing protein [Polyangiaceae bacterium]